MATFRGLAATNNAFTGTVNADLFLWAAGDLNSKDRASGAGGIDTLRLTTAGTLSSTALTGVTGIEKFMLAAGGNGIALLNANFAGVAGAKIFMTGSNGADNIDARRLTGANAVSISAGAGLDVLRGGAGRDTFRFDAANLAGDTIVGGGGADLLLLSKAGEVQSGGLVRMSGVEAIQFASGGNAITLRDGNFTDVAGGRITITGGAGADGINASALGANHAITVRAGAGSDRFVGGAGGDLFIFKAADLAGDQVNGRAGADRLVLADAGNVANTGLVNVRGVETFALAGGGNTITLSNSNFSGVAGGVIAAIGGAGNDTVDASALTGIRAIDVTAGAGADVLKGGAGADLFRFAAANLGSTDIVAGGGGLDTLQLTTAGLLAANALAQMTGVERVQLAAAGNGLTLTDANYAGGLRLIALFGGAGADTVNASGLTFINRIDVTAGAGADVLKGGAGSDVFRFTRDNLTSADFVAGGGGVDLLLLSGSGPLAADALANVTGVEQIELDPGGNSLIITDANFAVPLVDGFNGQIVIYASAGSSSIDGSRLTGSNDIFFYDGGGVDTVIGGAGGDGIDFRSADPSSGDFFDGGAGDGDYIAIFRSTDFRGSTIRNFEQLLNFSSQAVNVTISGENAADLLIVGGAGFNDVDDIFSVQLSAGSTTDLSRLGFGGISDAADAIHVVATGGSTTVTLSPFIASFTGSDGNDTVGIAAGGSYLRGAVVNGGGGDDRIVYRPGLAVDAGTGNDTLVLLASEVVFLGNSRHIPYATTIVANFENVDASGVTDLEVELTGRDDVVSILTGSAFGDKISAGAGGAVMTGGLGADTLTGGDGDDRFHIRSTDEVVLDKIKGGLGSDGIDVLGSADLTGSTIGEIETLYLAAGDGADNFTADAVTATLKGSQAASLTDIFGNGYFTDSVETLVVKADTSSLDLSALSFLYWDELDRVEITGTSGSDTITGTSVDDIIKSGGGFDTLLGGGGNDIIEYDESYTAGMNGGSGIDWIKSSKVIDFGTNAISIDLDSGIINRTFIEFNDPGPDTTAVQSITAADFENVDFKNSITPISMFGTSGANVLIGGSADDSINGRLGADSLTGGAGVDRFVWNDKVEGSDTITDFVSGTDKLVFSRAAFAVDGQFDNAIKFEASVVSEDITIFDCVFVTGVLNSAADVRALLDRQQMTNDHGMFVVASDSQGDMHIYYTANARGGGVNNTVFEIADLGASQVLDFNYLFADFVFV